MPTYPYACTACDHRFEVVQSFSDAPLTVCPVCEGRLRKIFTSVGVVFKGPGFYRTDSRAGSGKGSANGSGTAAKGSAAGEGKAATGGSDAGSDGKSGNGTGGSSSDKAGASAGPAKSPTGTAA